MYISILPTKLEKINPGKEIHKIIIFNKKAGDKMSVSVSKDNFDSEVKSAVGIVLADFYSESCVPCRRMMPVLAELEEDYGSEIKLAKINIGSDSELAQKYEVRAVPTIIFFKNGEEVSRITGAVKKEEISSVIDNMRSQSAEENTSVGF